MTRASTEVLGVRRCPGCERLLHARDRCVPCESQVVQVITDLGPTDGPGLVVPAQLGQGPHFSPFIPNPFARETR